MNEISRLLSHFECALLAFSSLGAAEAELCKMITFVVILKQNA